LINSWPGTYDALFFINLRSSKKSEDANQDLKIIN